MQTFEPFFKRLVEAREHLERATEHQTSRAKHHHIKLHFWPLSQVHHHICNKESSLYDANIVTTSPVHAKASYKIAKMKNTVSGVLLNLRFEGKKTKTKIR